VDSNARIGRRIKSIRLSFLRIRDAGWGREGGRVEVAEEPGGEKGGDSGGPLGGGQLGRRGAAEGMVVGHVGHLGGVAHSDLRRDRPAAVWR
jgi:hypothetical protein